MYIYRIYLPKKSHLYPPNKICNPHSFFFTPNFSPSKFSFNYFIPFSISFTILRPIRISFPFSLSVRLSLTFFLFSFSLSSFIKVLAKHLVFSLSSSVCKLWNIHVTLDYTDDRFTNIEA